MTIGNNLNDMPAQEQARHHVRVIGGKDKLTDDQYNLADIDSRGLIGQRSYVWDAETLSWIAQSTDPSAIQYDEIDLSYTGTDLTGVVYKLGGDTLYTLTLEYTDGNLTKVTKTVPV